MPIHTRDVVNVYDLGKSLEDMAIVFGDNVDTKRILDEHKETSDSASNEKHELEHA